jgi:hypothetical protein
MDINMIERISVKKGKIREFIWKIEAFIKYQKHNLTEERISELLQMVSQYEQQIKRLSLIGDEEMVES